MQKAWGAEIKIILYFFWHSTANGATINSNSCPKILPKGSLNKALNQAIKNFFQIPQPLIRCGMIKIY